MGRNLRSGPGPPSGRVSPAHIISCRVVLFEREIGSNLFLNDFGG
jgi:hypothetical protein